MENILQNLFTESLKYLDKKDFKQSRKILYQIIEKIKPEDLKKNSFILFNLGMCEMNMNNLGETVNAFVSIYEYYQTDKSLSLCFLLMYLMGKLIDYKIDIMRERFDFSNDNIASKCGCGTSFNFIDQKTN